MEKKHQPIYRDNILGITKAVIRRFAERSGILSEYKLSSQIYDEFRIWTKLFLTFFVNQMYNHKRAKYFLDPLDIQFNSTRHDLEDHYHDDGNYECMAYRYYIFNTVFERLMFEMCQNVRMDRKNNLDEWIRFEKSGFNSMKDFYVERSIDFFIQLKNHMDQQKKKKKTVSVEDMRAIPMYQTTINQSATYPIIEELNDRLIV